MPKKGTQEALPGMEARDVPEIEQAAENYRKIRDERCELSKREAEAKSALIQVLKNLGRSFYQYNGLKVQLEITDNVKVRASDDGDEEPTGNFTSRKRQVKEEAEQQQAEQQEQAAASEEERERLHREAVATWRRERPASEESEEEDEDYQAEWLASLTDEERNKYYTAPCECGHERQWHGEEDRDTADRRCALCKCEVYHCPVCDTKRGHQASCEYYALGEGTPFDHSAVAQVINLDDFTAERCDEAKAQGDWETEELKAPIEYEAEKEEEDGGTPFPTEYSRDEINRMAEYCAAGAISEKNGTVKICYVEGQPFVITGTVSQGLKYLELDAQPILPLENCGDRKVVTYSERTKSGVRGDGFYQDMKINCGSVKNPKWWVIVGPKITFTVKQEAKADDFTAPRCDECKRTDGAHTKECSKNPNRISPDDYLAYAQAHYKSNHQSHARKMALTGLNDDEVRAWKQQQAGSSVEAEPKPEKKKKNRANLRAV